LGRISMTHMTSKLAQIAKDLSREVDPDALHKIAELSDGSLRDAESLFDQLLCFQDGRVTADSVRQVFGLVSDAYFFSLDQAFSEYNLKYAFELVDHLFQSGKDLSHFLTQLIDHYRLITLAKTIGEKGLPQPTAARYIQTSQIYTQQQALTLLEYLMTSEAGLQKSLSPRIFLENVLLHIIRTKNRIPIEVLVRRLNELEGTLTTENTETKRIDDYPEKQALKEKTPEIVLTPARPNIEAPVLETIIATEMKIPSTETKRIEDYPEKQALKEKTPEAVLPPARPNIEAPVLETKIATEMKIPSVEVLPAEIEKKQTPLTNQEPKKHISHYDTLMRFAAVELEGSLKT
ncbi:MAG TPA: hypothetical protein VLE96_00465, partial [Chlamydiales bacterium]|nr:hypothetical protein [Chlamydiales bacterium]